MCLQFKNTRAIYTRSIYWTHHAICYFMYFVCVCMICLCIMEYRTCRTQLHTNIFLKKLQYVCLSVMSWMNDTFIEFRCDLLKCWSAIYYVYERMLDGMIKVWIVKNLTGTGRRRYVHVVWDINTNRSQVDGARWILRTNVAL